MKLLLVYDCIYPESLGGVEHRNYCLAQALAERGHNVTVAGWGKTAHVLPPGVKLLLLAYRTAVHDGIGRRSAFASLRFAAAVAHLDIVSYDAIETANIPCIHIFPLALRCWLARKSLIVTWYEFFGPYWSQYKGSAAARFYRGVEWLCAQVGHVTATSPLTSGRLAAARFGASRKSVPMIPGGVWLRDIQEAMRVPASNAPSMLYAGRLIAEKRVDLLLYAVAKLSQSSSSTDSALLGQGRRMRFCVGLAQSSSAIQPGV